MGQPKKYKSIIHDGDTTLPYLWCLFFLTVQLSQGKPGERTTRDSTLVVHTYSLRISPYIDMRIGINEFLKLERL